MAGDAYSDRPSADLLAGLRAGEGEAAAEVYARYAERLLALARSRLSGRLARRFDADDVLQSAYRSFFVRAERGEFQVAASGDLWRLLAAIVINKLRRQVKRHRASKRSIDREQGDPAADGAAGDLPPMSESTVVDALVAAEELSWLLAQLTPEQRAAVEQRLGGAELTEIAARLAVNERTVRRWLAIAEGILTARNAEIESRQSHIAAEKAPPPAPTAEFPLDPRDYQLHRLIGSGGVCKVYEATERSTGRRVCVKVLRREWLARPRLVERFVNEPRLVARLNHPRIVPIRGLGRLPSGGYFMVMDFIAGQNLGQVLRAGPLPVARACHDILEVAAAVEHAHERGVLHGDLKPENVLLDGAEQVWLTDFGFGGLLDRGTSGEPRDFSTGTPGFMAPEQLDPDAAAPSVQTDVYGLGALLHVLLTGRLYTEGSLDLSGIAAPLRAILWDPLESTCRHASLSIL